MLLNTPPLSDRAGELTGRAERLPVEFWVSEDLPVRFYLHVLSRWKKTPDISSRYCMIPVEISSNLNATGGPENQRKLFRCRNSVSYGFQVKSYASTLIVQRLNGTLRGMFEIWKMESKSGSSGLVWSRSTAVKE